MKTDKKVKACVAGASGYLGSFLVKELLQGGYSAQATLLNLGEPSDVELLKGLPHADTGLMLFEADIYYPDAFAPAIEGCEVVFHLANPFQHNTNNSLCKNTSEAAVAGGEEHCAILHKIGNCEETRLYCICFSCLAPKREWLWYIYNLFIDYVHSKILAEKEVLSLNGKGIEVVSLACGLVGGDTIQSSMAESMAVLISQITKDYGRYGTLRFLEELLGKVPILHIQDAIEAHIFRFENPNPSGRFLCARNFVKSSDITSHAQKCYPKVRIPQEFIEDTARETSWGSRKLEEMGFHYKYDLRKIIEGSIQCARRMGNLPSV